jgi:predicted permease
MNFFRRVWHLINRPRFERELSREMRSHREMMPDPRGFGDPHRMLERSRDAWGWNWLDDSMQDLRQGVRALARTPGFTVTAILILTFGIGLNLTLFQMANIALLRPPKIQHPETLAHLYRQSPRWNSSGVPYVAAQQIARDNTALSAVLLEASTPMRWGEESIGVMTSFVSPNWFSELGYGPLAGRVFAAIDGKPDAPPAVVVSHDFWKSVLGSDPSVLGTTVHLNKRAATLIGIMPAEFPGLGLDLPAVWLPINQRDYYYPDSPFLRAWDSNNTAMYGRLKGGISPAAARDMLRATMASLHQQQPEHIESDEWLEPIMGSSNFMRASERLQIVGVMSLLGALTSLVLLVAASNIGNLVLSRATGRARELGVRIALGARRSRIVRQLLIETLPLGLAGAAGGLVFATWASQTIAALAGLPEYLEFGPDWRAVLVSLGLCLSALALVGALPAWKVSQQELTAAIKDGGQQVSIRLDRARVRRLLLAAQVAGSCLLLAVSVMMARSLQRVLTSDIGFEFEQSAVLDAGLARLGIEGDAARAYWTEVEERVRANPETLDSAIVLAPPFGGRVNETGYDETRPLRVINNHVDPELFSLLEIPIVEGRTFEPGDDPSTAIVISRTLANRMYGTTDVVGKGFPKSEPKNTIVGVAADAHTIKVGRMGVAELYRPLAPADYDQAVLIARARTDAARLRPVLSEAAAIDPRVFPGVRLLRDDFQRQTRAPRIASGVVVSIGLLTLLLACIGIFGVVSYGVALRKKEIGIHLALGAGGRSILQLVMRQVSSPVLAGMVLGVSAAAPAAIVLSNSPMQLESADPLAYAIAILIFASAGVTAAMLPALRALRVDPIRGLRHE